MMHQLETTIRKNGFPTHFLIDYNSSIKNKREIGRRYYHRNKERIRKESNQKRLLWSMEKRKERAEYLKKYYRENIGNIKLKIKIYQLKNTQRRKEYLKQYMAKRGDWVRLQDRLRSRKDSEQRKIYLKKYYQMLKSNPERYKLERMRRIEWKKNNRDKVNYDDQIRKSRERCVIHNFSASQWRQKVKDFGYKCVNCNLPFSNFPRNRCLSMDHIIPLSKVQRGYTYSIDGVQPLCLGCNSAKKDKIP